MRRFRELRAGSQFGHNCTASVVKCAAGPVFPATASRPLRIVPAMGRGGMSGRAIGLPLGLFP